MCFKAVARRFGLGLLLTLGLTACSDKNPQSPDILSAQPVKVLSYRPSEVMTPLLERFTAETGIATQLDVRGGEGVDVFFQAEAREYHPDLIVVVDAQRLQRIAEGGALRALPQEALNAIPENWRNPDGLWAGLSWRLRAILQPADGPDVDYHSLPKLISEGAKVCVREKTHIYNLGLLNWLAARHGEPAVREWTDQVLARREPITGGDRDQIRALLDGRCDYAVVNHYYVQRLAVESDDEALGQALTKWRFGPSGNTDAGLYANISGIAVTRHGDNPTGADRLAGWLAQAEIQSTYAELVYEYPAAWPDGGATLPDVLRPLAHLRPSAPFPGDTQINPVDRSDSF